jgi:hypothetical protein
VDEILLQGTPALAEHAPADVGEENGEHPGRRIRDEAERERPRPDQRRPADHVWRVILPMAPTPVAG